MWIELFQRCGSLRIMDEAPFRTALGFFESLRRQILEILQSRERWKPLTMRLEDEDLFIKTAEKLLEQYNQEYLRINDLLGFDSYGGLQYVNRPNNGDYNDWLATLHVLLLQCDKAIEGLNSKIFPLTGEQSLTLKRLEEDLQKTLSEMPEIFEKNLREAIKECENGCFLGSALISARIICYILTKIPGNLEEKIKCLRKKGLIKEKGEVPAQYIMKADKKARDYLSHDLKALPNSVETVELLGICGRLLKLLRKYKETNCNFSAENLKEENEGNQK